MSGILHFSEAASLAVHGVLLLAAPGAEQRTVHSLAASVGASEAHMAKVVQRLGKAGILSCTRGPRGGVFLARPAGEITLLEVYEAVEGPLKSQGCALKGCNRPPCPVKGLVDAVTDRVSQELASKTLAELVECFHGEEETATECTLKHRRRRKKAA